mgnify:CR=1 FL=1
MTKAIRILKEGGIILYPSDTIWGIGCDATNSVAVTRIYDLKQRIESKSMICLVSDTDMLKQYVEAIPHEALTLLSQSTKPTTIVYDKAINLAKNIIAEDGSIGIRVVKNGFCNDLVKAFKKPIVSTSANISGAKSPRAFKEIQDKILTGVDYVVNLPDNSNNPVPSSVVKITNDGVITVLRA